ncbi:hypothetical protein NMG60_11002630 [Bertholletia excelsa]
MDLEQEVDNSWMDVQECFNIDEGAPSKKRKRGPRNLNAMGKRDKGKKPIQVACEVEDGGDDGEDDGGETGDDEDEDLVMVDNDSQIDDIDLEGEENEDI